MLENKKYTCATFDLQNIKSDNNYYYDLNNIDEL